MLQKLYKQLVALANVVSFTSITVTLPKWLVLLAGIICFIDYVHSVIEEQ